MTCDPDNSAAVRQPTINIEPHTPDEDRAGSTVGFLQVMPDDFTREELQNIRDRARRMSIPGSLGKTTEERLYQKLADIADTLDAIAARWESDLEKSRITITTEPVCYPPPVPCGKPGCCGNPPLIPDHPFIETT